MLLLVPFILILTIIPQNAAADGTQQVNASEILENITRGDPVYVNNNSIIVGDLDVSKIWNYLEIVQKGDIKWRVVESSIEIRDSTIQGNVNFNPIYFNDTVEFKNVTFEGSTSFYNATFNKQPDFQKSSFKDLADFSHATFNGGAHFFETKFNEARFWNATFNKPTFFHFSTVYGDAVFDNTFFNKSADFTHFVVERDATFDNATFNDSVDFNLSTFNELAWFKDANFNGSADFLGVNFNGRVNFEDTKFNAPVNFIQATFSDTTVFQNTVFNTAAYFILARFKDRTYFTGAVFNDSVDFSEADIFQTMKINWNQLDGKLVYNDYFYQVLIRNFETLGQSDDWRDAYYEYHVERGKRIDTSSIRGLIRKVADCLLYIFCGYGVKPSRPLGLAFVFILSFAGIYWAIKVEDRWKKLCEFVKEKWKRLLDFIKGPIMSKEDEKPDADSSLEDRKKGLWERFKDWLLCALPFIYLSVGIFTTLGLLDSKKIVEDHQPWFSIFVILEVFLGWILMTLFVISLTLTYIK